MSNTIQDFDQIAVNCPGTTAANNSNNNYFNNANGRNENGFQSPTQSPTPAGTRLRNTLFNQGGNVVNLTGSPIISPQMNGGIPVTRLSSLNRNARVRRELGALPCKYNNMQCLKRNMNRYNQEKKPNCGSSRIHKYQYKVIG